MSKRTARKAPAWVPPLLLSAAAGLVCTCAAMAVFAFLTVKCCLSSELFYVFSTISVCLGCFASGMAAAKAEKSGGLRCGLTAFAAYAVVLAVLSAALGCRTVDAAAVIRTACLLPAGCAGGMAGLHSAEKQLRHRRT